jgi:drug/metabolite transporter (DMT)-like permease
VPSTSRAAAPWLVWANLAIVYLIWGSTYLAIRVAVQTMPPLMASGIRFLFAGAIVYVVLALRRGWTHVRLSRPEVAAGVAAGAALVLGGNGLVMIAEQTVPSGHAALIIGSTPLWIILLRLLAGERVSRGSLVGVALGFVGVGLLVVPGSGDGQAQLLGLLLLVVAAVSWAVGSYFSRRMALPADPFLSTAVQMVGGGALVFGAGIIAGESAQFDPARFSTESVVALAYLLVFGSLIAFTAYTWLLQNAPISLVSTYAYVNPVVAVFLGWLILQEQITSTMVVGAVLIVAAVAFVIRKESRSAPIEPATAQPIPAVARGK